MTQKRPAQSQAAGVRMNSPKMPNSAPHTHGFVIDNEMMMMMKMMVNINVSHNGIYQILF